MATMKRLYAIRGINKLGRPQVKEFAREASPRFDQ